MTEKKKTRYRVNKAKLARAIAILACLIVFVVGGITTAIDLISKDSGEPLISITQEPTKQDNAKVLALSNLSSGSDSYSIIDANEVYKVNVRSPKTGIERIDTQLSSYIEQEANQFARKCGTEIGEKRSELTIKYDISKVEDKLISVCFYKTEIVTPAYTPIESSRSYVFKADGEFVSESELFTGDYEAFFNGKIAESIGDASQFTGANFHPSILFSKESITLVFESAGENGKLSIPISEAARYIADKFKAVYGIGGEIESGEDNDDEEGTSAPIPQVSIDPSIDPSKPVIAFTFDDGPNGATTKRIVDALKKNGARATFFIVGNRVNSQKQYDALQAAIDAGCEIANHTYSHAKLTKISVSEMKEEIEKTNTVLEDKLGVRTHLLRPPGGFTNDEVKSNVKYPIIKWDVDTEDWKSRDKDAVVAEIKKSVKDGAIVLMHDLYQSTAEAVEEILPWLVEQGYQVVTVSELMEIKGIEMERGKVYFGAN